MESPLFFGIIFLGIFDCGKPSAEDLLSWGFSLNLILDVFHDAFLQLQSFQLEVFQLGAIRLEIFYLGCFLRHFGFFQYQHFVMPSYRYDSSDWEHSN